MHLCNDHNFPIKWKINVYTWWYGNMHMWLFFLSLFHISIVIVEWRNFAAFQSWMILYLWCAGLTLKKRLQKDVGDSLVSLLSSGVILRYSITDHFPFSWKFPIFLCRLIISTKLSLHGKWSSGGPVDINCLPRLSFIYIQ